MTIGCCWYVPLACCHIVYCRPCDTNTRQDRQSCLVRAAVAAARHRVKMPKSQLVPSRRAEDHSCTSQSCLVATWRRGPSGGCLGHSSVLTIATTSYNHELVQPRNVRRPEAAGIPAGGTNAVDDALSSPPDTRFSIPLPVGAAICNSFRHTSTIRRVLAIQRPGALRTRRIFSEVPTPP